MLHFVKYKVYEQVLGNNTFMPNHNLRVFANKIRFIVHTNMLSVLLCKSYQRTSIYYIYLVLMTSTGETIMHGFKSTCFIQYFVTNGIETLLVWRCGNIKVTKHLFYLNVWRVTRINVLGRYGTILHWYWNDFIQLLKQVKWKQKSITSPA